MPLRTMRHLSRERRRIALVTIMAFAALMIAGVAAPWPRTFAVAIGVGGLSGLFARTFPRRRTDGETVALAALAFAAFGRTLPDAALAFGTSPRNTLLALAFFLSLVALAGALRRSLAALALPSLPRIRLRTRAETRIDIFRLWHGLVPAQVHADNPAGLARPSLDDASLRLGRVRRLPSPVQFLPGTPSVEILEIEAPFHVRMRVGQGSSTDDLGAAGVSEIFLVDLGPRRLVFFAHEFPELPLGRALLAWIDDAPGRLLDQRLALIERRARMEAPGTTAHDSHPPRPATVADWDADAARDAPPDAQPGYGDATGRRRAS